LRFLPPGATAAGAALLPHRVLPASGVPCESLAPQRSLPRAVCAVAHGCAGTCDALDLVMPTLRKSIAIRAPVDRVFEYVGDPTNLPEIWPSLVAVRNVEPHPTGNSFDWDYKLLGLRIHGHSEPVERIPNARLVTRSVSGIPNTFRWTYGARGDETEVTLEVEYELPALGWLAQGIVGRVNEREAHMLLANLKRRLEAPAAH
jgi:uncharacterized membrane protein